MDEYIKREEAISALNKVRDDQRVFKYATASDFLSARDAIERAAKVLESLPATDVEPVKQWISVKDRLPEPYVPVLVQMPGEKPFQTVREGFLTGTGIWHSALFDRRPDEVTHWMPLPEPPKGE